MSVAKPLKTIPVGVVIERRKAKSQWIDFVWRPTAVLPGVPDTDPGTMLSEDGGRATFYVGAAEVELYPSDTTQYRDNLQSGSPSLWVVLRPASGDPPYGIHIVTADPTEGEGQTAAGDDLVEPVAMPEDIVDTVAQFVAEHHVERVFYKRKRKPADPEALARRPPIQKDRR